MKEAVLKIVGGDHRRDLLENSPLAVFIISLWFEIQLCCIVSGIF